MYESRNLVRMIFYVTQQSQGKFIASTSLEITISALILSSSVSEKTSTTRLLQLFDLRNTYLDNPKCFNVFYAEWAGFFTIQVKMMLPVFTEGTKRRLTNPCEMRDDSSGCMKCKLSHLTYGRIGSTQSFKKKHPAMPP
jgi:hypothetical protein